MTRTVLSGTRRWWVGAAFVFVLGGAIPARAQVDVPTLPVDIPTLIPTVYPTTAPDATALPDDKTASLPDVSALTGGLPGTQPQGGGGGTPPGGGGGGGGGGNPGSVSGGGGGPSSLGSVGSTDAIATGLLGRKPIGGVPAAVANESYGNVAGRALGSAAGRALRLAEPLAPALVLAIFVLTMVALVSRGSDKLARAEIGRRVYRL